MLGIPSFALSQAYTSASKAAAVLGDRDRPRARHHPHACCKQGIPRDVLVNVNFPGLPARRGEGHRGVDPGQARPAAAAHRRAPRRPRQSVLLDRLCARRAADRQGRHRSRRAGRQPHLGHAAAARSHRPAVPDASSRSCFHEQPKWHRCGEAISKWPTPRDESEQRMEFLLTLRRRGISDQAVLRAMDEVPREHFVEARVRRHRLCRPGDADRLRPDHQPALCRRLHDRAARR